MAQTMAQRPSAGARSSASGRVAESEAMVVALSARTMTTAAAPKAPIDPSRIIERRSSRVRAPKTPSAVSASPSTWRAAAEGGEGCDEEPGADAGRQVAVQPLIQAEEDGSEKESDGREPGLREPQGALCLDRSQAQSQRRQELERH